jgi:23S rRNA (pseudouridine1915-N3)-methyltransferase
MKVQLWSFGKENETYISEGMKMFSQRLQHYCDFELKFLNAGKNAGTLPPEELKKQEARVLLSILEPYHILIVLDERGKEVTSQQLALLLDKQQMLSARTLIFLIGGAYGIDESILLKAREVISLSRLTFPHQLVRLLFTEQIYRAFTILKHEKYHHQ